jgi:hypothetical protein
MKKALVLFVLAFVPVVNAAIVCDTSVGTGAPPSTLGGFTMTPFAADPQPSGYSWISGVASPACGTISFSAMHAKACSEWATWSHGYCGDIYYTGGATSLTITMPAGVSAFYAYAEPNPFGIFTITATANDGASCSASVDGYGGAAFYGFYGTGGTTIASITWSSDVDFAVGEFGIACGPSGCPCDDITQVKAICTSRGTLIAIVKATATGTCTIDVSGVGTSTVNLAQGRRGIKGTAIFRGVGAGHTVCLPECPAVPCGAC